MGYDYETGAAIEPPRRDAEPGEREDYGDGPGECPECGGRAGPLIIDADWWMFCAEHRLTWCVGRKITDAWQRVTAEAQGTMLAEIDGFRIVPAMADVGILDDGEKAAHARLKAARAGKDKHAVNV